MSLIVSKLSDLEARHFVEDKKSAIFSWDKKEFAEDYFDLKDFAAFFKIKNFHDLSGFCPEEYSVYRAEVSKIKSWILTFGTVPDKYFGMYDALPSSLVLQFLEAKNILLSTWTSQIASCEIYEPWFKYYEAHRASFRLLRDMRYEIQTRNGPRQVDLEFAENFRFKAVDETFNLFHMPKKDRGCVIPQSKNHFLYMVDFRQFEFRTFLMLVGVDVDFEIGDLYKHLGDRLGLKDPKLDFISYLYSQRTDENIKSVIDKNEIMDKMGEDLFIWREYPVFFKKDSEYNKKIHSIIQTVSYLIYLEKFSKVLKLLEGKDSKLIFPLHDAMIFSISTSEMNLLDEIPRLLVDDVYKIKQYFGKNLLEMENINE